MKPIEKNTNQLYRQKYFVDETHVIRYRPAPAVKGAMRASPIVPARQAKVSQVKVPMHEPPPPADAQISVQVVKDGAVLRGIRIQCPCGRHAELDIGGQPAGGKG
jgi:hypothetical protein